jgi:hypothetical protein
MRFYDLAVLKPSKSPISFYSRSLRQLGHAARFRLLSYDRFHSLLDLIIHCHLELFVLVDQIQIGSPTMTYSPCCRALAFGRSAIVIPRAGTSRGS